MPYVEFLQNYTVNAVDGASYTKGQIVELSYPSAKHYIARGVAKTTVKPELPIYTPRSVKAEAAIKVDLPSNVRVTLPPE